MESGTATLANGTRFEDRYEIQGELGSGSFGRVYQARQLSTGQSVAIKVLSPREGTDESTGREVERFRRETQICAELSHVHIVQLIDSGETEKEGESHHPVRLVGIVVNNGIILVDHMNRYREKGHPLREAIRLGGEERLRPILITALTTITGMLPLALAKARTADFYYYTLPITIIGGLAFSTFLTLLVLPVLYDTFHGRRRPGEGKALSSGSR